MCEHGTHEEVADLLAFNGAWHRRSWPIDACIASLVKALNLSGTETVGSCCGHGRGKATILVVEEEKP